MALSPRHPHSVTIDIHKLLNASFRLTSLGTTFKGTRLVVLYQSYRCLDGTSSTFVYNRTHISVTFPKMIDKMTRHSGPSSEVPRQLSQRDPVEQDWPPTSIINDDVH